MIITPHRVLGVIAIGAGASVFMDAWSMRGLGIASSKTPRPVQAKPKSFVTHVVFGVWLYLCAVALNHPPFAA